MRPPTWWGCTPLRPSLCQEEQTAALSGRGAGSSTPVPDPGGQRPRDHRVGVEIQAVLAWPPPPMCSCAFKGPLTSLCLSFLWCKAVFTREFIHPTDSGIILNAFPSHTSHVPSSPSASLSTLPSKQIEDPTTFPACTSSNTSKPSTALAWLFNYPVITRWLTW